MVNMTEREKRERERDRERGGGREGGRALKSRWKEEAWGQRKGRRFAKQRQLLREEERV